MNITLSENTVNPQKSKLQKRFDKLWSEVKNQQQANAKLKQDLSELHIVYQEKVLPVEQLTEVPYTQLAQRLIEFFSRKSLTQWQRHELSQWIMESIDHVQSLNPQKSHELTESYHQVVANFLEVDIEDLEEEMNPDEAAIEDLFTFFEDIEKTFHGFDDSEESAEDALDDDNFKSDAFEEADSGGDKSHKFKEKNLLSEKWLRTVFRRTANALHPDKERDESRRKEKENLMAQLLSAREEKDVFSLLSLYMQYVDSSDLLITDETMENLCKQLGEQKYQLNDEKYQMLHENPMYSVLYKNLYGKSKKKREKNIEQHIQKVKESTQELSDFVASLRNLKVLKVHLEDRYQESRFMGYGDWSL